MVMAAAQAPASPSRPDQTPPTSSETSVFSSKHGETVTFVANTIAPRHSHPRRRNGHPAAAGYLSDRATTAFIRRVLCAKDISDKERSSPAPVEELLPPLTSRNDVDLQLYALISVILREYVQSWYSRITPDENFTAEIVQIIAHFTRALEQRLRQVDLESLLLDELPELLDAHILAYRAAEQSSARPPLHVDPREVYHALNPLPALSPVPKSGDSRSIQTQAENEAAYRQLLVQGVLALLLPTEDLENECLTSLVGQIFSELLIGNLIANKVSEPWFMYEVMIILTRLVHRKTSRDASRAPDLEESIGTGIQDSLHRTDSLLIQPTKKRKSWSVDHIFWLLVQWTFIAVNSIRLIINTLISARLLPSRPVPLSVKRVDLTSQKDDTRAEHLLARFESPDGPAKIPIINFHLWSCISSLLEMDARMPWLSGALSMLQWGLMKGPGKVASCNGIIDRLLSHHIHNRLLDPALLPPLLRAIRATLFPNNVPGAPGLVPPASEQEYIALRRRCASAIRGLVPRGVRRVYFGEGSVSEFWPWAKKIGNNVTAPAFASRETHNAAANTIMAAPVNSSRTYAGSASPNPANAVAAPGRSGPLIDTDSGNTRAPSNHNTAANTDDPVASPQATGESQSETGNPTQSTGEQLSDSLPYVGASRRPPGAQQDKEGEERTLIEIEEGILDVFSDAYCNKHLMYGVLELILVRLMPELAEKGIIELWEERLS